MAVEAYLAENFQKVYAEPTHIDEFLQNSGFNISSLAEKAQFVSGQPTDVVNFEELMNVRIIKFYFKFYLNHKIQYFRRSSMAIIGICNHTLHWDKHTLTIYWMIKNHNSLDSCGDFSTVSSTFI